MSAATDLENILNEAIRAHLLELRVCLPGRIEKYDPDTMLAEVQPLLKRRFYGRPQASQLPIIARVPVVHPRTQRALIRLPIKRGDIVTLVFADRSLENWLAGAGEEREPLDTRAHNLSDAYAIPGGYPERLKKTAANPEALEVVVEPGTKITIGNGTDELLQIAHDAFQALNETVQQLSDALGEIQNITHTDSQGGTTSPPLNAGQFATLQSSVDAIVGDVDAAVQALGNLKV